MSTMFLIIFLICISKVHCNKNDLEVVFAINAGGYDHTDKNGIHYDADFLTEGIASDYGNHLLIIGRVPEQDEVLYKTERYHTSTFGYDLPLDGDGQYALVLKFCEVYFNKPNKKIFDVILNRKHEIVSQLDIFAQVGRGSAHEEYVFFNVKNGKLLYKGQSSDVRQNRVRLDFIKGPYDNPKINAFVLFKGNVERIPRLPPLINGIVSKHDNGDENTKNLARKLNVQLPEDKLQSKRKIIDNDEDDDIDNDNDEDIDTENDELMERKRSSYNDNPDDDDDDEFQTLLRKTENPRKHSGPRQIDPYSMDDTKSILLPIFITIGAFIPLLFCLCKL